MNSLRPKQPSELVQCLIGLEISRSLGRAEEVREVKVPLLQNAAVLSERMACFLTTSPFTNTKTSKDFHTQCLVFLSKKHWALGDFLTQSFFYHSACLKHSVFLLLLKFYIGVMRLT